MIGVVTMLALAVAGQSGANPCFGRGTLVLVDTAAHRMHLCQGSVAAASHRVALGWRGIGKRRRGDGKTPLGVYPLGPPRPSRKYGVFIPVEYPTPEQRQQGFTGSAIGIHGPPRDSRHLGLANVADDWTLGCIAVADDATIQAVAAWVRANRGAAILIE
jgi:L,D-peptidoglycan transpeptidase YkuD (ErfK/YbiS/YcfS/YnhG family)